jgi:SNF2-related domain/Helicase conserved C-terminal domain/Bacterial SNF2 helicase associated
MSDLFSELFPDKKRAPKKVFANPNTVYNTVIFIISNTAPLPGLEIALHPAQNTKDGISKLGRKMDVAHYDNERMLYETHAGGLADLLLHFARTSLEQWAQKRSIRTRNDGRLLTLAELAGSNRQLLTKYYHSVWKSYWPHLTRKTSFFTCNGPAGSQPQPQQLQQLSFSPAYLKASVKVGTKNKNISVTAEITAGGAPVHILPGNIYQGLLYIADGMVYLPENPLLFQLLENVFEKGELQINPALAEMFLTQLLPELQDNFAVELSGSLKVQKEKAKTVEQYLVISEMDPDLLVLKPIFKYDEAEVEYDETAEIIELVEGKKIRHIERDKEAEAAFKSLLQQMHPLFATQNQRHFFHLPVKEAVKNHWFFELAGNLQQLGIATYGLTNLKKLKYNVNTPFLQMGSGSGADWFDLKISLQYGEQTVSLSQLRQAVLNKQDYVQLGDGTWGLLPQEWLQRFTAFFKLGKTQNESVQVSKRHFTIINDWQQIDNTAIAAELEQKKQQLLNLENQQDFALPQNLQATMRPYQAAGYQWLRQLHSIGWGGCLADDMGLGKTLQTLAFLQSIIEQNNDAAMLIVCPASLLYNWAAEIEKFTPQMRYHLYHGGSRAMPENPVHLLITSYGTMRSDMEQLKEIHFEVVVLDESQVIKNPASQIAKAVQLLKAKSRFVLSGTPVQNNTMDIYPQLNFTNPGLLGSSEMFKELFVNPIDKKGDAFAVQQLKKMIGPFLLRRTKEQVAKDLPDKTETVLYCEMDTYQRKVYDAVREEYRSRILQEVEEAGMSNSLMLLLEGLGRLRMICDCPSLVMAEDGKRFNPASAKADELMREIEENSSNHKILVFSQFLGMLQIIQSRLQQAGLKSLYLDGSTKPAERGRLVKQFQEEEGQQVFLISLKAGGVGLNLTAADYVYLLDPWWNPAAEDQAIDRTHRIGQTQKVFAYKMICRNTVEEKIMQLQQKKKQLARDLISEENSFVKKLTVEDVAFLLA